MIAKVIEHWRRSWSYQQRKHELGPDDDDAWNEYVNSLTMAQVLEALATHGEIIEGQQR